MACELKLEFGQHSNQQLLKRDSYQNLDKDIATKGMISHTQIRSFYLHQIGKKPL